MSGREWGGGGSRGGLKRVSGENLNKPIARALDFHSIAVVPTLCRPDLT